MDLLTARILDSLMDDEEQMEEIYLGVNFERTNQIFRLRRTTFRLYQLADRLRELEQEGILSRCYWQGCSPEQPLTEAYFLTDRGRALWKAEIRAAELYD